MGDIGDGMDDDILLFLQLGQLGAVLGDLIGKLLHLRQNGGNILALLLILRYQLRDPVLLGLHVIHRRINGAPLHIDLQDLIDLLIHVLVAALHRSLYPLRVLSYYLNIQHQNFLLSVCFYPFIIPTCLPLGKLFRVLRTLFYKKSVPAWASPRKPLFLARRPAHIRPAHPSAKSAAALFRSLQHPGLRPAGQTVLRTVSAAPPPAAASGGRPCGPTDPPRDAARPLSRRPAAYPPGRSDHPHHCTLSSECLPSPCG